MDINIAFYRDGSFIARRLQSRQVASIIRKMFFGVHAIRPNGTDRKVTIDGNTALRADRARCLYRCRIIPFGINFFDLDGSIDLQAGIRICIDAVGGASIRIRGLDGQRLFCTTVHDFHMLVAADIDCISNLACAVRFNI